MQATCDKQSFSSNPSLAIQSHTDDEKEDNELKPNRVKSVGSQMYERQRQRVENSLVGNVVNSRPFSTLQRNSSRSSNDRPKVNEIESLREEDESSITRAQSLRNLTQKFESMQPKNLEGGQQTNGVATRPAAKRFSMMEPSLISNGTNGTNADRGVLDITPSKESLIDIHHKLEGKNWLVTPLNSFQDVSRT